MAWANKGLNPKYLAQARACFERALALDPANVNALVGIGRVDAEMVGGGLADDREARLASAEAALTKALSLSPNDPWAHAWLGLVYCHTKRAEEGIAEAERALSLDRNLAHAYAGMLSLSKFITGRAEECEAHAQEGIRLSPRDSNVYIWAYMVGIAKLGLGEDEGAANWLRLSIETNRNFPVTQFLLAAALANLGQEDAACAAVRAGLALDPSFTVQRFRFMIASHGNNPKYRAQCERLLDSMAKAGVPVG
jgi:tetratricopeptide (TPR) repeat protein